MEGYSKSQEADQPAYNPQAPYPAQPGYGPSYPPQGGDPAYPPTGAPYAQPPPTYGQTIPSATYAPGGVNVTTVTQSSPPNYMGLAIFVTICCCWPIGICAILKASEVGSAFNRGDYAGAKAASDSARKFSYISLACGIASIVISVVFIIIYYVVIVASFSTSDYN
ncbi:proline-rich transmembrane protein 1-like [Glandiceps talaboti]